MDKWNLSLPKNTKIPNHIGIIPDGNRRWAKARNLPSFAGHKKGFDVAVEIPQACWEMGIHTVSIWCFSTENWNRSKKEIDYLMGLYRIFLKRHLKKAKKQQVRIIHLGRKDRIPKQLSKEITKAEAETKHFKKYVFNLCLDYGGQDDLLRAVKKMAANNTDFAHITKKELEKHLDTHDQPHPFPDLIIRTSGEQRLSGFMSWQNAYSEFYFEPDHFPDFTPAKLIKAILDFSNRHRRFGGN